MAQYIADWFELLFNSKMVESVESVFEYRLLDGNIFMLRFCFFISCSVT